MKLKCTIGSLSCDGVLAEKGELFELPDAAAKSVIESGYAIEIQDEVMADMEVQDEVPVDKDVHGVTRYDGATVGKPQKNKRKKQ